MDTGDSLSGSVVKSSLWLGLGQIIQRLGSLISTVVLARLLFPDDYGLVALGTAIIGFFEVISNFQFGSALVKFQDATRGEYDTAWTCNILRGVLIALLMVACAPLLAKQMNEVRLEMLLYVLALNPLIDGWKNIGVIDFQKNLKYQRVVFIDIATKLTSLLLALIVAVIYRSYWALVAGMLAATSVSLILSYLLSPYRPSFSLSHTQRLFGFSLWLMFAQIMVYFNQRLEYWMLGALLSTATVGLYHFSYELANLIGVLTLMPLIAPLFPGFAKVADDRIRLKAGYLKSVEIVSLLGIPIGLGFAVIAPEFVPLVLGEKWISSVLPVQIFCIMNALVMPALASTGLLPAIGETKAVFKINLYQFFLRLIAVPVAISSFGFFGAVVGRGLFGFLWMFQLMWFIEQCVQISMADTFRSVWRYYAAAVIMVSVLVVTFPFLQAFVLGGTIKYDPPFIANPIPDAWALAMLIVIKITLGVLIYGCILWFSWQFSGRPDSGDKYVAVQVKSVLGRLRALKRSKD